MPKLPLLLVSIILIICSGNIFAQHKEQLLDSAFFQQNLNSFTKGNNYRRYRFLKKYTERNALNNLSVKTQAIDWLGVYRNVIVEKKGETDSVVYIVCHYDKIDGNLLSIPNLFVNGAFDILLSNFFLSKGACDNGTGVVSSLALMEWINTYDAYYTYRFLFAGMEEYGLRGSRRHVSGLSQKQWSKCVLAINIDMVGSKETSGITVSAEVTAPHLMEKAITISELHHFPLAEVAIPDGGSSDFASFTGQSFLKDFGASLSFNVIGALLPQRSYFTKRKHAIPVINFTEEIKITATEYFSLISPISFGRIHSFRDRPNKVSMKNLVEHAEFFRLYIESVEPVRR
jgi:hypothetical protein